MRRKMTRLFWWQVALLLFAACFVIGAVMMTVHCSQDLAFEETAALTDVVLTVFSCTLILLIGGFALFVAIRRARTRKDSE